MGWIGFLNFHIGPRGEALWFKEKVSNPGDKWHKTKIYIILEMMAKLYMEKQKHDMLENILDNQLLVCIF